MDERGRSSLNRLVELWNKEKSDDPKEREAARQEILQTGLRMTTPLTGIPDKVPDLKRAEG